MACTPSPRECSDRIERRQAPRFPLALAVRLEHGEGRTRDVSASGLFVATQGSFSLGASITFVLELEHADPTGPLHVTCEGRIVRVEPGPDAIGVAVSISAHDFGNPETWGASRWAATAAPEPTSLEAGDANSRFPCRAPTAHRKRRRTMISTTAASGTALDPSEQVAMDRVATSESEAAIERASPDALRIVDRAAIVPGKPPAASLLPRRVPAHENPVARVRQETALWTSPGMREVRDVIAEAAHVDVTVLITGETGTGKELVARAIHYLGPRCTGPFVKVNCAAVARELLESELFGHERGAFTGAHELKIGKFEAANHGTIFLDEIGDLHPALQAKLLHVLEDGQFSRVGGHSTIKVDVRVVAATNQDLERAVAAGEFREDLFYRLNVIRDHRASAPDPPGGDPAPGRLLRRAVFESLPAGGIHAAARDHAAADAAQLPRQRPRAREHHQAHDRAARSGSHAESPRRPTANGDDRRWPEGPRRPPAR